MRLNRTAIPDDLDDDATSLARVDNMQRPLSKAIGKLLLDSFGLANPDDGDER